MSGWGKEPSTWTVGNGRRVTEHATNLHLPQKPLKRVRRERGSSRLEVRDSE